MADGLPGFGTLCFSGPAAADRGQKCVFILAHLLDQRLIARIFVRGRPQHHFGEDRGEIDAFPREQIDAFARIGRIALDGDDPVVLQQAQAPGQNVRGDAFVGFQEFLERFGPSQHHVSDDEQRPAIAQHFDRGIQGTPGTPAGSFLLCWHG
jgi:hypothetical protein